MEDNYNDDSDSIADQRTKKFRSLSTSSSESVDFESTQQRLGDLELDTVKELFQRYDLAEGDNIPCCICGKCFSSLFYCNVGVEFFTGFYSFEERLFV